MRSDAVDADTARTWQTRSTEGTQGTDREALLGEAAGRALNRAARRLARVAEDPRRLQALLDSLDRLPAGRVRQAALACLGFDDRTAAGLDLRLANHWPLFRGGRAAMPSRPPLRLAEAAALIRGRAEQIAALGAACRGLTLGQVLVRLRTVHGLEQAGGNLAGAVWDGSTSLSGGLNRAGPWGSLLLSLRAEEKNEDGRRIFSLLACTEAMDLRGLATEHAAYLRRYGVNRAAVMVSPLPFGGTAVSALAESLPRSGPAVDGPPLWQLIAEAAGEET